MVHCFDHARIDRVLLHEAQTRAEFRIALPQTGRLADLRIGLHCPVCSHDWVVVFDIASFLWKEIDDWAGRMLRDVSDLAAAYGWSEAEILDISPVRRQLYLGMLAR